jgi:hypothetical protein
MSSGSKKETQIHYRFLPKSPGKRIQSVCWHCSSVNNVVGNLDMKSLLFWDVTLRTLIATDLIGQPLDSIFKGQAVQCSGLEDGTDAAAAAWCQAIEVLIPRTLTHDISYLHNFAFLSFMKLVLTYDCRVMQQVLFNNEWWDGSSKCTVL